MKQTARENCFSIEFNWFTTVRLQRQFDLRMFHRKAALQRICPTISPSLFQHKCLLKEVGDDTHHTLPNFFTTQKPSLQSQPWKVKSSRVEGIFELARYQRQSGSSPVLIFHTTLLRLHYTNPFSR
ncbi:hypothetical protein HD806DRAFT_82313 [Xylariaceae sp. AK1471]|nr:hypothetical protein HD806DRAFT_82313 [Xylariaceae sp. AK1471]